MFALIFVVVVGTGCGVQGDPLPPLLNVPQRAELHGVQRGDEARLAWTMPSQTTEGQTLRPDRLGAAEIHRALLPGLRPQVDAREFEANARRIAEIPPGGLQQPQQSYVDRFPPNQAGSTAAYALLLKNSRGRSAGFSNIVVLPVLRTVPAPAGVRATATETGVVVEWPAVTGAHGYSVYRGDGAGLLALKGKVSGDTTRYADEDAEFGQSYRYVVRSSVSEGQFTAESADSAESAITPEDKFPPPAPTDLVAIVVPGAAGTAPAIELSWAPNTASDFGGYIVYRSEGGGGFNRVNGDPLGSPAFRDVAARPGVSYSYAVSAVDRAGNESERSAPVAVTVPGS